ALDVLRSWQRPADGHDDIDIAPTVDPLDGVEVRNLNSFDQVKVRLDIVADRSRHHVSNINASSEPPGLAFRRRVLPVPFAWLSMINVSRLMPCSTGNFRRPSESITAHAGPKPSCIALSVVSMLSAIASSVVMSGDSLIAVPDFRPRVLRPILL